MGREFQMVSPEKKMEDLQNLYGLKQDTERRATQGHKDGSTVWQSCNQCKLKVVASRVYCKTV